MVTEAQKRALAYGPQPDIAAASLRAPMRSEILVFAIATSNKTFNIPTAWLGAHVNFFAEGADVYLQFSTGLDAVADETAVSTETSGSGRYSVAAAGNEAWKIPQGQWIGIPIPANAQTMGTKALLACKLRTHLAET